MTPTDAPRTRYARTSAPLSWLEAPHRGFVGAITDAVKDRIDCVVLAWPFRPDNGFVAAAIAVREMRATGSRDHATLAVWPWRSAATHAARSILVHAGDICKGAGRQAHTIQRATRKKDGPGELAHDSLCLVELRLNDLKRSVNADATQRERAKSFDTRTVPHPTLLETTPVFAPQEHAAGEPYLADADQILRRIRRYADCDGILNHVRRIGDPMTTPFAVVGLNGRKGELQQCLRSERFRLHGLDAVVVDLTHTAHAALSPDWPRELRDVVEAIRNAPFGSVPPVVVLCEDGIAFRRAEKVLRSSNANRRGQRIRRRGAVLTAPGILSAASTTESVALPPLRFEADIKDAALAPLRERILSLARRLRQAGRASESRAVGAALRALSTFASLPLGVHEARDTAAVLFDDDDHDSVRSRSSFFPTSALQPLAQLEATVPEFAPDIRAAVNEITAHLDRWHLATPVSLKVAQLLNDPSWNAPDVLLVFPDDRTSSVFSVSDSGLKCLCTCSDVFKLAEVATTREWRRIVVLRPELRAIRVLLPMPACPEKILILGDAAGITLVGAELHALAAIPEFSLFAGRTTALLTALQRGGCESTVNTREAELQYPTREREEVVDLTRAADGYQGPVIQFELEGGGRAAYRPSGEVLVFMPDEARQFRQQPAAEVMPGDSILVLRQEVRDRLSIALSRSRRTATHLKAYHERVVKFRDVLPGTSVREKARAAVEAMRALDASVGHHEIRNVMRWLSVSPSDEAQQPRAPRERSRFLTFMRAAGVDPTLADAFWDVAITPVRAYSVQEGHAFNRRIVQFVLDPEGVAAAAGWRGYHALWQSLVGSVDCVVRKAISDV